MAKKKANTSKGTKKAARAASVDDTLERVESRDAVRHSQRLASQLHQLISASLDITALRDEPEILGAVAESARDVFGADAAVVTWESTSSPLRAVIAKHGDPITTPFDPAMSDGRPTGEGGDVTPWRHEGWLVAPVVEERDRKLGVVGVQRDDESGFSDEDQEILMLLAQLTSTALSATRLNRTIETNEARLRVLVESAPVGLVEVDAANHVVWWNGPARRLLSWPDVAERPAAAPDFAPMVRFELEELWAEVRDTGEANGREIDDVPVGNHQRHWTVTATALPVAGAAAPGVLTLIDDVTDTRQLRAEVRHAQTMEMRGQVASRLAHDFNNLLTLVSGYAEILSQNLRDDRSLQMVKDIQSTASRAALLTGQLQTIGRTKIAEPVLFNPITVIASNAEVLERVLGSAVELEWRLDQYAGAVKVDADQFEQMIINLALNARDAMPDGGRLTIGVARAALTETQATELAVAPGDYVHLAVTDTGVGMDDETQRRCFEPLFTTKGPFKGTGMGLSAAQRLVVASHGAIACTSAPGEGTTIDVYLPFAGEAAASPAAPEVVEIPRGSATVLLVDDDEGLRRLMSQVLSRNGYHVVEAASGEEAAQLAGGGEPDLLVSDVVMGEMSGRDLAEALQGRQPGLKVLLTSGTAEPSIVNGLGPGRASFLAKPFKPSGLIDAVHELLTRA
ncbi:MAG TPA: response regulator [Acidimicrobiales bacterium]|nr:response regulator [Acidimicrobiales bacterium]